MAFNGTLLAKLTPRENLGYCLGSKQRRGVNTPVFHMQLPGFGFFTPQMEIDVTKWLGTTFFGLPQSDDIFDSAIGRKVNLPTSSF